MKTACSCTRHLYKSHKNVSKIRKESHRAVVFELFSGIWTRYRSLVYYFGDILWDLCHLHLSIYLSRNCRIHLRNMLPFVLLLPGTPVLWWYTSSGLDPHHAFTSILQVQFLMVLNYSTIPSLPFGIDEVSIFFSSSLKHRFEFGSMHTG